MAILTRYPTAPTEPGNRPPLAWASGISPNRRWVPAHLPADGATLNGWTSQYGDLYLPARDATKPLTVGAEASIRYALTDGTAGQGLSIDIADPSTARTVVVIARPNTGDTIAGGSGRLLRFGNTGYVQQQDADTISVSSGGGGTVAAVRDKWHVYAISLPAVGSSDPGVIVVDGSSTTFTYSDATWDASALRFASSSDTNSRELRILEILTSASTFTAAELILLYAKAKAWYPGLTW